MRAISFRRGRGMGVLLLSTFLTANTLAQGVVNFNNAVLLAPPDRTMRDAEGTAIGGTNFWAQLYYQNNAGAWVGHSSLARFRTGTAAGFWLGGNRTLVNAGSPAPGVTRPVNMYVAAWYGGASTTAGQPAYTFDQARAAGRFWTLSPPFCYTQEFHTPPESGDTQMKNFVGSFWYNISAPPYLFVASRRSDELRLDVECYYRWVIIETATNLGSSAIWTPVLTNRSGTLSFWYTNSAPSADRQRFYRARLTDPCPP